MRFHPLIRRSRCIARFQHLVAFEPHQAIHAIFGGKSGNRLDLMLPYSPDEIRGRTDVQGTVRLTGQQIDKKYRDWLGVGPGFRRDSGSSRPFIFPGSSRAGVAV